MTPLRPSRSIATTAIVALLTLVFPYLPPKAQLNGVAPFLYYYSKAQSSFVVERADGRNSRILTKFTLTEKIPGQEVQAIITGPGWSPSGNWFAWRETTNYGGPSIGYIVSRDGSKQLSLLNGLLIAHMEWSPTKDLLMAMVRLHDSEPFTYDIYIVNMHAPEIPRRIAANVTESILKWTPDGRYLVSYVLYQTKSAEMDLFTENGLQEARKFYQDGKGCYFPSWSGNGQVAYVDVEHKHLVIDNMLSKTEHYVDAPEGAVRSIEWSPDNITCLSIHQMMAFQLFQSPLN